MSKLIKTKKNDLIELAVSHGLVVQDDWLKRDLIAALVEYGVDENGNSDEISIVGIKHNKHVAKDEGTKHDKHAPKASGAIEEAALIAAAKENDWIG